MNLILHIGTEKTGTTSIQSFLKINRIALMQNGIYVPQSTMTWSGNQRWLPIMANRDDYTDDFVKLQNFKNQEEKRKKIIQKKAEFLLECQNLSAKYHTLILSSEHLQSRLTRKDEIQKLKALLDKISHTVCIVVYIRDPLSTAISHLSTMIKNGQTPQALPAPNEKYYETICNHAQTIKKWGDCFPEAKFIIRRFDKKSIINNNVIVDFCTQFIPNFKIKNYKLPVAVNTSLTLTGMKLLRKLNLKYPPYIENLPNPMRRDMTSFVMKNTSDGSKFLPSKEEYEAYHDHFAVSCENVREHYFPSEKSLFTQQYQFSNEKIDLREYDIDSSLSERLIYYLWEERTHRIADGDIYKIRDLAIKISEQKPLNLNDSLDLMRVAQKLNPQGHYIKKKIYEWEHLTGSNEPKS